MGYYADLVAAADWLASIQRPDGGWGLVPGQDSSVVNTAEALFVLRRAGNRKVEEGMPGYNQICESGLHFLKQNTFRHVEDRGPRTRYVAFALCGLADFRSEENDQAVTKCREWLVSARNRDFGWSVEAQQGDSQLFPTCLAVWALQRSRFSEGMLKPSLQWLLTKATDAGWTLDPASPPSAVATAYALICLVSSEYRDHPVVQAGTKQLLQTRHWGTLEQTIAGTSWKHSTYAWVVPAIVGAGENPHSPVIAEAVRYVNSLKSANGGWNEIPGQDTRTVRSQFWATMALDALTCSFDPAIHVLRIDAERAQTTLTEPDFVAILVQSPKWSAIIPSRLYRLVAYSLQAGALLLLFGVYRQAASLPPKADAILASLFVGAAALLMMKRKHFFGRGARIVEFLAAIAAGADLLLGISVTSLMESVKGALAAVWQGLRAMLSSS